MKHTPGEWRVAQSSYHGETGQYYECFEIEGDSPFWIAKVQYPERNKKVGEANARLIAAAPEMLQALKEINQHLRDVVETQRNGDRNNWEGYYVPEFAKLSQKFTDLIKKAEGSAL
jgi:hypothetical protein